MSCGCNNPFEISSVPSNCATTCKTLIDASCIIYNGGTLACIDAVTATPVSVILQKINTVLCKFTELPVYDDDDDASGLEAGTFYQTSGDGASPLNVAGIVMVKQ